MKWSEIDSGTTYGSTPTKVKKKHKKLWITASVVGAGCLTIGLAVGLQPAIVTSINTHNLTQHHLNSTTEHHAINSHSSNDTNGSNNTNGSNDANGSNGTNGSNNSGSHQVKGTNNLGPSYDCFINPKTNQFVNFPTAAFKDVAAIQFNSGTYVINQLTDVQSIFEAVINSAPFKTTGDIAFVLRAVFKNGSTATSCFTLYRLQPLLLSTNGNMVSSYNWSQNQPKLVNQFNLTIPLKTPISLVCLVNANTPIILKTFLWTGSFSEQLPAGTYYLQGPNILSNTITIT